MARNSTEITAKANAIKEGQGIDQECARKCASCLPPKRFHMHLQPYKMMGGQTVGLYQHTTATCAAGIIGTTTLQSCGCLHAPAARGLFATTAVALSSIQKNHSVEIARSISSTSGGLAETRAQIGNRSWTHEPRIRCTRRRPRWPISDEPFVTVRTKSNV